MKVTVEFLGGLDIILNKERSHSLVVDENISMKQLIDIISTNIISNPHDVSVFIQDDTIRPGILVLINDTDWELEGMEEYLVQPGDVFTFTSTLHGG